MPINRKQIFPIFNTNQPNAVLGIPNNITVNFGIYNFNFVAGYKVNHITKSYNGDYQIIITNIPTLSSIKAPTDTDMTNLINNLNNKNFNSFIKQILNTIGNFNIEINVFNWIQSLNQIDEVKTFLYYSWHRFQIEDRCYPKSMALQGRNMFINLVNTNL